MVTKKITKFVFAVLFAALISAGAFIVIPFGPVPIVLQNLFTLLAALVLGPVYGSLSVALFLAAGAIGVPVFANNGTPMGIARIIGPTGGYLFGYLLGAFVAGLIAGTPRQGEKKIMWRIIIAASAGTLTVYLPGLFRLKFEFDTWRQTLAIGLVPFIAGDLLKSAIAVLIAPRLRRTASQLINR